MASLPWIALRSVSRRLTHRGYPHLDGARSALGAVRAGWSDYKQLPTDSPRVKLKTSLIPA